MKKFLSMVLAMVMTLSLVTVSAGAKEFPDNDQLTGDADGVYAEAVNVLSEMGIIDGDTDGNFKPKGTLTRGAASKIIACMMLGKTTAESLGTAAAPFKDVPVGSTFAGYIAYCVEQGIIDGYADGTFRPSGALTGYAFQKMLLTALGYDSKIEGYANNPNWRVNVTGRATQEGILRGLDASSYSAAEAATREQACLMALNTIKTPLVEYASKGVDITIAGVPVSQGASTAKYVTTVDQSRATAIDDKVYQTSATGTDNSFFVEFGEQYQPDLRRDRTTDDFGRPSYTWVWQKDDIDTYVDYSLMLGEYNTGVTGRALRELISQSTIDRILRDREGEYAYYVDGVEISKVESRDTKTTSYAKKLDQVTATGISLENDLIRGNEKDAGMTKNGVLTQVFLKRDTASGIWELTITSIDTWLAKANSDYNKNAEELSVTAYTGKDKDNATVTKNLKIDVEDVPAVENVKKDDFILIQRSGKGDNTNNPTLSVVDIKDVEILSDQTVTQFSKGEKGTGDNGNRAIDKLTTGGTQYNFSQKCFYDAEALDEYDHSLLTNMTYDVYLDEYGYVIGVTVHEGNRNYVFITAFDTPNTTVINRTATATAIFLDGSIQNITVNTKDTDTNIDTNKDPATSRKDYFRRWDLTLSNDSKLQHNRWYTYTVNAAGVYTLKPAERMLIGQNLAGETLNSANLSLRAINKYSQKVSNVEMSTEKTAAGTTRVYGNDDSIYITVETDTQSGIRTIDDVRGLYTGVQNVKLDLSGTGIPEYVYALYDSNNYIIAAVVLGEAQGSISNYAYIYSQTNSEKYEDGYYYWTFDAIQNGEFKTFTARSKFSDTMKIVDDNQYHMMQLLFDGDYVSRVRSIGTDTYTYDDNGVKKEVPGNVKFWVNNQTHDLGDRSTYTGKKFEEDVDVLDIGHINLTDWNGSWKNSVLMENCGGEQIGHPNNTKTSGRIQGTLSMMGNTLYISNLGTGASGIDHGLALRSSAKAVVINEFNGDRDHHEFDSVRSAIDNGLRDADDDRDGMQFQGRIIAPLSNGVAQWVIFISDTPLKSGDKTGATTGTLDGSGNGSSDNTGSSSVKVPNTSNLDITLNFDKDSTSDLIVSDTSVARRGSNGELTIQAQLKNKLASGVNAQSCLKSVTVDGITYDGNNFKVVVGANNMLTITSEGVYLTGNEKIVVNFEGMKLYREPDKSSYNVTFKNGNETIATDRVTETTAEAGVEITLINAPTAPAGKAFDGWKMIEGSTPGELYPAGAKVPIKKDTTFEAVWKNVVTSEDKTVDSTVNGDAEKAIDASKATVAEDETGKKVIEIPLKDETNANEIYSVPVTYTYISGGKTYKVKLATIVKDGKLVITGIDPTAKAEVNGVEQELSEADKKLVEAAFEAAVADTETPVPIEIGTPVEVSLAVAVVDDTKDKPAADPADTWLLGKKAADLQNITVNGLKVTGTSKYVTGYTDFSSKPEEQEGNYIALKLTCDPTDAEKTITYKSVDGTADGYKTLGADGILVWKVTTANNVNKNIEVKVGNKAFTIDLSGLKLEAKPTAPATEYNITITTPTNGTVTTTPATKAAADTEVTITATPAAGYVVDTITVTDADDADVTVTDDKFTMPAKAVAITVTFEKAIEITAGTQADKNGIITFPAAADYTVAPDATNPAVVNVTATNIVKHTNGADTYGYWVGATFTPVTAYQTDYVLLYKNNQDEWAIDSYSTDDGSIVSQYLDAATANATKDITIGLFPKSAAFNTGTTTVKDALADTDATAVWTYTVKLKDCTTVAEVEATVGTTEATTAYGDLLKVEGANNNYTLTVDSTKFTGTVKTAVEGDLTNQHFVHVGAGTAYLTLPFTVTAPTGATGVKWYQTDLDGATGVKETFIDQTPGAAGVTDPSATLNGNNVSDWLSFATGPITNNTIGTLAARWNAGSKVEYIGVWTGTNDAVVGTTRVSFTINFGTPAA